MKPAAPERVAPIRKPIAASRPSGGAKRDEDRQDDGDDADRRVLAPQEGHGAFLDGRGDLLHPLVPVGLAQHPSDQVNAVKDCEDPGSEAEFDPKRAIQNSYLKSARAEETRACNATGRGRTTESRLAPGLGSPVRVGRLCAPTRR